MLSSTNNTNVFLQQLQSPINTLYIKLEMYDSQMNYIEEFTENVTSDIGFLTIDSTSPIRRSFTLRLNNSDNKYTFGSDKLVWLDKRIKLYTGLLLPNGNIEYVLQGLFVLTEPDDTNSLTGKFANIHAVDKAYLFTGNRGKFINETIIEKDTSISTAIRLIATANGESMFNFDEVTDKVPYELSYGGTDNRWDAMQELATLAKCTLYYDVDGYLRLKKIDLNEIESLPTVWKFEIGDGFYAGNIRKLEESKLANDIVVLGGSSDVAVANYRLTVDESNSLWTNHPYSTKKIGTITYHHNNGNPDPLLTTNDECKWRAKWELMNRLGYNEQIQMTSKPHYLLDVEDVIEIYDDGNDVKGKYIVNSINLPLSPQQMTINIQKQVQVISNWDFI